jgi:hypothetical protein
VIQLAAVAASAIGQDNNSSCDEDQQLALGLFPPTPRSSTSTPLPSAVFFQSGCQPLPLLTLSAPTPTLGRRPLTPLQLPVRPASVSLDSRRSRHLSKDDIARLMAELNAPLPPMAPLPQEIIRASPLFFSSMPHPTCS